MKKTFLSLLCLSLSIPCYARTITVDADRSGDYPTIQAATDSDTVPLKTKRAEIKLTQPFLLLPFLHIPPYPLSRAQASRGQASWSISLRPPQLKQASRPE